MASQPVVTFDLDGVLCRPPFGINPGKLRKVPKTGPGSKGIAWWTERWRFYGRSPMPGAVEGLRRIAEFADCFIVTGRSEQARKYTEGWLKDNFGLVPKLHMRPHWSERPPQFKNRILDELGSQAHFEDDPNTAVLLAPVRPVFVVDWPRNAGLERDNVMRVPSVEAAVEQLRSALGLAER